MTARFVGHDWRRRVSSRLARALHRRTTSVGSLLALISFALILLICMPSPAIAQPAGTIAGHVVDESGGAVVGASVTARGAPVGFELPILALMPGFRNVA
jgi:hypothetical protein